ncbi:MAG: SAM-dependent chlorinase/fluorinase [Candidatus Sulfobium sp.]|jgi:S-adenosylmethionine hydrolase
MPESKPVITLTTDFGYRDPFVGVMKGVILKINPAAQIVDLTHGIAPQGVREAAFSLGVSYKYFPDRTIHVVVVDPGVGSGRRTIIVSVDGQYFVGPDNGVFSYIYRFSREAPQVVRITAERYFLSSKSATFQGRDLFAPVAAWLSKGIDVSEFGVFISDYQKFEVLSPKFTAEGILTGEVIHVDGFGNAITNIRKSDIDELCGRASSPAIKIIIGEREVHLKEFYSQADSRELYSLVNSSGYLEFFVNRGNAADVYKISTGDKVEVRCGSVR